MPKFKFPKITPITILITIFTLTILLLGIYFAYKSYSKPKFRIQPIETEVDKELNELLKKELESSIYNKDWVWIATEIGSAQKISPFGRDFIIKFDKNGTFISSSDCNSISGKFLIVKNNIYLRDIIVSTKFCPKSRESNYVSNLENVVKFRFDDKKRMVLELKNNEGFMIFDNK